MTYVVPPRMLPEGEDGCDVTNHEHGKDDARRFSGAEDDGEHHEVDEVDAGEACLRHTNSHGADDNQNPLECGELWQGEHVALDSSLSAVATSTPGQTNAR